MEPVRFIYMMDLVNLFAAIIAIHVGISEGALFAFFWTLFPRLCGAFLPWIATIKDAIALALGVLVTPFVYAMTGDLFTTMIVFSLVRMPIFFILCIFIPHKPLAEQAFTVTIAGASVLIINAVYVKLFGEYFENMLRAGVSFPWVLLLAVTIIMGLFYTVMFGRTRNISLSESLTGTARIMLRKKKKKKKEARTTHSDELQDMERIKEQI